MSVMAVRVVFSASVFSGVLVGLVRASKSMRERVSSTFGKKTSFKVLKNFLDEAL